MHFSTSSILEYLSVRRCPLTSEDLPLRNTYRVSCAEAIRQMLLHLIILYYTALNALVQSLLLKDENVITA